MYEINICPIKLRCLKLQYYIMKMFFVFFLLAHFIIVTILTKISWKTAHFSGLPPSPHLISLKALNECCHWRNFSLWWWYLLRFFQHKSYYIRVRVKCYIFLLFSFFFIYGRICYEYFIVFNIIRNILYTYYMYKWNYISIKYLNS